jgi:hypothetical protein
VELIDDSRSIQWFNMAGMTSCSGTRWCHTRHEPALLITRIGSVKQSLASLQFLLQQLGILQAGERFTRREYLRKFFPR